MVNAFAYITGAIAFVIVLLSLTQFFAVLVDTKRFTFKPILAIVLAMIMLYVVIVLTT